MKDLNKKFVLILILIIAISSFAYSQKLTGTIKGLVEDNEGTPLPGVSVTATSPSLQGSQSFITTDKGVFRFPSLPPGIYEIRAEIEGFQIVKRPNVIVSVGKSIDITIVMELSLITEEVIVTAPSPMIDTKSSKIAVNYVPDLIRNLPIDRNLSAIINLAPGVVGGTSHGGTDRANTYAFDGVNMNDPITNQLITNINFDVIEEVEMITGGPPAEVLVAEGAYINVVTKAGGNKLSGSLTAYFSTEDLVRSVIPEKKINAIGLERLVADKKYLDGSAVLGGPIIQDKLWFFLNGRYINQSRATDNPDYDFDHTEKMIFSKITYQISPNLKLLTMFNLTDIYEPMIEGGLLRAFESTRIIDHERVYVGNGILSWIFNQDTYTDFRFSYVSKLVPYRLQPESEFNVYYYDGYTRYWGGSSGKHGGNEDLKADRIQTAVSLTRFQDNFLGGNHEFKVGLEYGNANGSRDTWRPLRIGLYTWNDDRYNERSFGPYSGFLYHPLTGDKPGDYVLKNNIIRYGGYIQDSFTIKKRLTINVGLRYDEHRGNQPPTFKAASSDPLAIALRPEIHGVRLDYPEIKDIFTWRNLSPRLGISFDIFGDGKSSFKAFYGQFPENLMIDWYKSLGQLNPTVDGWIWRDLNQNRELDIPPVDSYENLYALDLNPDPTIIDRFREKGTKAPYTSEFNAGISHQLFKDFSLGVSFIYKEKERIIMHIDPIIGYPHDPDYFVPWEIYDPGYDQIFGTDDDNTLQVWAEKLPRQMGKLMLQTTPDFRRKYRALELTFNKRMSARWQLSGSVVWSKSWGHESGTTGLAMRNPSALINKFGSLSNDRPLIIKLVGTVILPFDIYLSGYFRHSDGAPLNRRVKVFLPGTIDGFSVWRNLGIITDASGTNRDQGSDIMDLRIEKKLGLGKYGELSASLDVLNILGSYNINVDQSGGILYEDGSYEEDPYNGNIMSISGSRTVRITFRYSF